jgi:hypothetical protein
MTIGANPQNLGSVPTRFGREWVIQGGEHTSLVEKSMVCPGYVFVKTDDVPCRIDSLSGGLLLGAIKDIGETGQVRSRGQETVKYAAFAIEADNLSAVVDSGSERPVDVTGITKG